VVLRLAPAALPVLPVLPVLVVLVWLVWLRLWVAPAARIR